MKCKNCKFSVLVGYDKEIFECHLVNGPPVYKSFGYGCCEFWKEKEKDNIIWLVEKKK